MLIDRLTYLRNVKSQREEVAEEARYALVRARSQFEVAYATDVLNKVRLDKAIEAEAQIVLTDRDTSAASGERRHAQAG